MFEIESSIRPETNLEARAVVDVDRDVKLVYASGHGRVPGSAFVLTWGDRVIPFDTSRDEVLDDPHGVVYYRTVVRLFGASPSAENAVGAKPFAFADDVERSAALRLAIEALLVYGSNYNGLSKPDGYNRVLEGGREWGLSDFGIKGSAGEIA
jgi:hypothetical protein